MKTVIKILAILILSAAFYGCGGIMIDEDFERTTTALTYKQLLGTYVFKPDPFQANKLGVKSRDPIVLKITDDSLSDFTTKGQSTPQKYYRGKYYIDKMVLTINPKSAMPYSDLWMFFHIKQKVGDDINDISFNQKIINGNKVGYQIQRDENGTLHIAGYISDPKYEVIKISDFKKVK